MSKFHSIVSRRDFMKGLGLGAAGLGAAAAAGPVFHDLDELASSSPEPFRHRSWWVKEVDKPTVEIDWSMMARHHGFHSLQSGAIMARYIGLNAQTQLSQQNAAATAAALKAGTPGFALRDTALNNVAFGEGMLVNPVSEYPEALGSSRFVTQPKTPEQLGVPKWEGTPEENFRMLKAAMIFLGAADIGADEWTSDFKKLVGLNGDNISQAYFPYEGKTTWPPPTTVTRPIVFTSEKNFRLDLATGTTYIPADGTQLFSVPYVIPQSHEMFKSNTLLAGASNGSRYRLRQNLRTATQGFLKGLGYQSLGDVPYRFFPVAASTALSGLSENSRQTNMCINPEYGSTAGFYELHTDLPLAPQKPIDAGIWRFCQSCGVCAKYCPSGAIEPKEGREPSWEPYASHVNPMHPPLPGLGFDPMGPGETEYFKIGRKTHWNDMITCAQFRASNPSGCRYCFGTCVFNESGEMIHQLVKATVGTTGLFNSFFANMSQTFGYTPFSYAALSSATPEAIDRVSQWWDMSMPSYGYDTTIGAHAKSG